MCKIITVDVFRTEIVSRCRCNTTLEYYCPLLDNLTSSKRSFFRLDCSIITQCHQTQCASILSLAIVIIVTVYFHKVTSRHMHACYSKIMMSNLFITRQISHAVSPYSCVFLYCFALSQYKGTYYINTRVSLLR